MKTIGFVGTGTIADAVVSGICAASAAPPCFLVSPRNADVAAGLARRFATVTVAPDNQAVLDGSDVVILAVTPQVAESVLASLTFRRDHQVVSLIATFELPRLAPLVAPAAAIVRAAPTPAAARGQGAVVMHPPTPDIAALFQGLGEVIQVAAEPDLDAFVAVTGLMGSYFALLDEVTRWLSAHVSDPAQVRAFVAATFHGLGDTAQARAPAAFGDLAVEHSTPLGLNEQARRELEAAGWTQAVADVLDLIHARIQRRATFADGLPRRGREEEPAPPIPTARPDAVGDR